MLKFIILCICLIYITHCFEHIPPASEIRKIVAVRRDAAELEHQRMIIEAQEYNQRIKEEIQRNEEERVRQREVDRESAKQVMVDYCTQYQEDVYTIVHEMIELMKESDDMDKSFYAISYTIGVCAMQLLIDASYSVIYIPHNWELRINLDAPVEQSQIEMQISSACSDTIIYAIDCGQQWENCMLFQVEFAKCMENGNQNCFDIYEYTGMKEVRRYHSNYICA